MKNKIFLVSLLAVLLASCNIVFKGTSTYGSKTTTSESTSGNKTTTSESTTSSITTTSSKDSSTTKTTTSTSSTKTSNETHKEGTTTVSFAAINDFHGHIEEEGSMVGLAKLGTYFQTKKSEGSILMVEGDTWQETYLASESKGTIISQAFNKVGVDVNTLGNHDFDWGVEAIKLNEQPRYLNDKFLGANIMDYPKRGTEWTKAELGQEYKTFVLDAGTNKEIKVGVVGVIGKDQLGSITSKFVEDYVFYDHNTIIKNVATKLRNEEKCDIVVASCHTPASELDYSLFNKNSDGTRKYIDAAFCAHDHSEYLDFIDGVPVIEGQSYGRYSSEVTLNYDFETKTVIDFSANNVQLSTLNLTPNQEIANMVLNLKSECDTKGNTVYGYSDGYMSKAQVARWQAKVMADKAIELGHNIDFAITNSARAYLNNGEINYYMLYETHPFINDLYFIKVNGHELLNELSYTEFYRITTRPVIDSYYEWYNIVIYNFLLFHVSINDSTYEKVYNYFPSLNKGTYTPTLFEHDGVKINVLDLTIEDLQKNGTVHPNDYSGNTWHDDVNQVGYAQ